MARKRAARRRRVSVKNYDSQRTRGSKLRTETNKGLTRKEKLSSLDSLEIDINMESISNVSAGHTVSKVIEDAILVKLQIIIESLEQMVHDYIIYLVNNQDFELPEFSGYMPLSSRTMEYGVHPHNKYFYDWSGDLIENGIKVSVDKGDIFSEPRVMPSINIAPANGIHFSAVNGAPLSYTTLFRFLEYGTSKNPSRPFFAVIEPKVADFVEKLIQRVLEGSDVDTSNFSWT